MLRSMPNFQYFLRSMLQHFQRLRSITFLFTFCWLLAAVCRLRSTCTFCILSASFCLLSAAYCLFCAVIFLSLFYGMLSFLLSAVYCLLASESCLLSALCFLLSAFSFAQRVRKFFSEFYKTCYMY
jgi:hypothetical protein